MTYNRTSCACCAIACGDARRRRSSRAPAQPSAAHIAVQRAGAAHRQPRARHLPAQPGGREWLDGATPSSAAAPPSAAPRRPRPARARLVAHAPARRWTLPDLSPRSPTARSAAREPTCCAQYGLERAASRRAKRVIPGDRPAAMATCSDAQTRPGPRAPVLRDERREVRPQPRRNHRLRFPEAARLLMARPAAPGDRRRPARITGVAERIGYSRRPCACSGTYGNPERLPPPCSPPTPASAARTCIPACRRNAPAMPAQLQRHHRRRRAALARLPQGPTTPTKEAQS